MISNVTKIAAGASLLGAGALGGLLLAPDQGETRQAANTVAAPAPVVRTVHIKRVHRRTIHERPRHVQHSSRVAAAAAAPVQQAAPAAAPVQQVAPAPPPAAPAPQPISIREDGSSGQGSDDHGSGHEFEDEHESEHESGDD